MFIARTIREPDHREGGLSTDGLLSVIQVDPKNADLHLLRDIT